MPAALRIASSFNRNIIIVVDKNTKFKTRKELFIDSIKVLNMNLLLTIEIDTSLPEETYKLGIVNSFDDLSFYLPNGGTIITITEIRPVQIVHEILNHYTKHLFNNNNTLIAKNYTVYSFLDDFEEAKDPTLSAGHYIASSFLENEDNPLTRSYINSFKTLLNKQTLGYQAAAVYNSFHVLTDAAIETGSFALSDILNHLYNKRLNGILGTSVINVNHHVNQQFIDSKIGISGRLESPQILSKSWPPDPYRFLFNLEESKICNLKKPEIGINYSSEYYLYGLLTPTSYSDSLIAIEIIRPSLLAVEAINSDLGVNDRMIVLRILDDGNNPNKSLENVQNLYAAKSPAVFGLWNSDARKLIGEYLVDKDMMLFYSFKFEGRECFKNIVYMDLSVTSLVKPKLTFSQH